jgi:hypothetical protein
MEYLKTLHNKEPNLGGTSNHDTCIKEMYSCGRKTSTAPVISNLIGLAIIILLSSFLIHRFLNRPGQLSISKLMDFSSSNDVFKMFISLLLLTNIKTLSNSLIANIILPMLRPILPLLSCNLKIKVGLFSMNVGDFISDVVVFGLNLYIIYFLFAIIY